MTNLPTPASPLEGLQREAIEHWRKFIDPRLVGSSAPWPVKQSMEDTIRAIVIRAFEEGRKQAEEPDPCPVDPRCTLPRPHSHEL